MRHIKQMTLEELEAMIEKVDKDKLKFVNSNFVLYKQLDAFADQLKDEARQRAKEAGHQDIARKEYGVLC